ncbi:hypothetical protein VE03_06548 [Pseudogymnoascus sp. 23342-1-I1]|nr:hypothetical protein VE03_06548 [Pseudogymnoascus sp. 23342-1-I1]
MKLTSSLRASATAAASRGLDFTHAVIGGGVVGLAIARRLAERAGGETLLVERHGGVGMESSSRNSEVIHAGLYYGKDSLKTKLCIEGRERLYDLCGRWNIPHKKCGKWIVAQTPQQLEKLQEIHALSNDLNVPTSFIPLPKASALEPLILARTGVLESPTTGIIDSHTYIHALLGALTTAGADIALHTSLTSVSALPRGAGWELTTLDAATGESSTITTATLVNAAGLGACVVNNMVLPPPRHRKAFYAKGSYFSYSGAAPASRLIYPAPEPDLAGLGTHLTLDMAGRARFGPDVEWVESADDLEVDEGRLPGAVRAIRAFVPGIERGRLGGDYAGVRAKLGGRGEGMRDFVVRREEGCEGFVNLLGIESPGLTSSLAIAEMVGRLVYGEE